MPTHTAGKLTVGTDNPAYEPWFSGNDPSNGKGYESAVAYAIAEKLGYAAGDVTWVKVPFTKVVLPGAKGTRLRRQPGLHHRRAQEGHRPPAAITTSSRRSSPARAVRSTARPRSRT